MADLLTHVLIGYSIGMILSWKYDWIKPPYVTGLMVGAALPDIVRIRILIDSTRVESFFGIPFSWTPLHTGVGVFLSLLVLTSFFTGKRAKRIFLIIGTGAISHLFLDSLLISASGFSYPLFWPLTYQYLPSGGLYLSSDMFPAVVAAFVAFIVWFVDNHSRTGN